MALCCGLTWLLISDACFNFYVSNVMAPIQVSSADSSYIAPAALQHQMLPECLQDSLNTVIDCLIKTAEFKPTPPPPYSTTPAVEISVSAAGLLESRSFVDCSL